MGAKVSKNSKSDAKPAALVVCGPSGVGKGTIIGKLMEGNGDKYGFSVSHTTRGPRPGEASEMCIDPKKTPLRVLSLYRVLLCPDPLPRLSYVSPRRSLR